MFVSTCVCVCVMPVGPPVSCSKFSVLLLPPSGVVMAPYNQVNNESILTSFNNSLLMSSWKKYTSLFELYLTFG